MKALDSMKTLVGLAKRRGFVFPGSDIYGGLGSCWDYGPLGVELKNNVKNSWWKAMRNRDDMVGMDAAVLMHPLVWKASGHEEGFHDPLVDCRKCKARFRADQVGESCPKCGARDSFTDVRNFNLMFKTRCGVLEEASPEVYLRPETAQGIFVNFLNVQSSMRKKIPFGICQIGKAFRNEVTPGNFIFRTREFEQMEMQYFVKPGDEDKYMDEWRETRWNWHISNGLTEKKLRMIPHEKEDLAHYAKAAEDVEYEFPMGWGELEGIHSRGDFDLKQHQEFSGKNLFYTDQVKGEKYLPYVVETSTGCDRVVLAVLCDAYREEENKGEKRVVMGLASHLAPVNVAVLPLMRKEVLTDPAKALSSSLRKRFSVEYDETGTIGKRYRRQDEIGTPFCLTFDYDGLDDKKVTVRNRDTMEQKRILLDNVEDYLGDQLNSL